MVRQAAQHIRRKNKSVNVHCVFGIHKPRLAPLFKLINNEMKQTAVEWYWDKIKSHFEHDGDLLETAAFTFAIAKQKEREQIIEAWDGGNYGYFYSKGNGEDFDNGEEYYNEIYGGKK